MRKAARQVVLPEGCDNHTKRAYMDGAMLRQWFGQPPLEKPLKTASKRAP